MKIKSKPMSEYTHQEIIFANDTAMVMFENHAKNLLACFDSPAVYSAMASLVRLEGLSQEIRNDFSPTTLCALTAKHFLTLLARGALDGFLRFALTPEAQAELDELNAKYGQSVPDATGNSSPDPTPVPKPTAEEALADQVIRDWNSLPTDAIRKKKASVPGYAAAIEHAVEAGQI